MSFFRLHDFEFCRLTSHKEKVRGTHPRPREVRVDPGSRCHWAVCWGEEGHSVVVSYT